MSQHDECCDRTEPSCSRQAVRRTYCTGNPDVDPEDRCRCARTLLFCLPCFDAVTLGALFECARCAGFLKIKYSEAVRG
jgi:hypothetical protein